RRSSDLLRRVKVGVCVEPYDSKVVLVTHSGRGAQTADAVTPQHERKLSVPSGFGNLTSKSTIKLKDAGDFREGLIHGRDAVCADPLDLALRHRQELLVG